ncbi:MAG: hypothetical protein WA970_25460, partial [Gammaproteobacteria bacterium]
LQLSTVNGEAAFDLAGELAESSSRVFADNEEVVGMPTEMLCLEVDLRYDGLNQNRRNATYKQLCKPVRCNVLLEEGAGSARGRRTRCALSGQQITPFATSKRKLGGT